jgi:cytochrome c-type biogenesis protein CcmE
VLDAERVELTPVAAPSTRRRGRGRTLGVLVVLAAAVLVLLGQGLLHSLNYFETVDQALGARARLGTSEFRLEGVVEPTTITRTARGANFWIAGARGERVFVRAVGSPPQLFQANIPVVVQGHFVSATSDTFDADQILVKHTASYIAAHPARVRAPNGTVR